MTYLLGLDTTCDFLREFKDKQEADDIADEWVAIEANSLESAALHYEDARENWMKNTPSTPYVVADNSEPILKHDFKLR